MSGDKKHILKSGIPVHVKMLVALTVSVIILAAAVLGFSLYLNEYRLELNIPANETIILEYGEVYDFPDVTATYFGTIWKTSGVEVEVKKSGMPDFSVLGEYTVTYTASYKGLTASAVRTILVEDHEAPVITLISDPDSFTNPNDAYQEEGYAAWDNYDGDLTAQVICAEKDGVVTYTVEDSSHNRRTITREIVYRDAVAPVLTLQGENEVNVEAGEDFVEPGFSATDDCDGDITSAVTVTGSVDNKKPGIYKLTYQVQDSSGNTAQSNRIVTVQDTKAPSLTLNGDTRIYVKKGSSYTDPGVTANDACDGEITDQVQTDNPVDTENVGIYTVKYTVTDSSGNKAAAKRTVYVYEENTEEKNEEETAGSEKEEVKNSETAEIESGKETETETKATEKETGEAEKKDSEDDNREKETEKSGDTGENAESSGSGSNQSAGDDGESKSNEKDDPGEKVIYLTFDDGPGKYTEELLDILDKYDVKVTFFVTNQYPKYQYLIAEEYNRGHTVAIHTYSHDYSTIYASENAFYEDVNKMNDIIYEQTGTYATILRFPGGSSNTVSKKYCEGIMTALTESLEIMGFRYTDWNVTSGDAGETKSTSKIISNVISGIRKHTVSVVLQHDIHKYSVDAVEDIIIWGLENGYTFRSMDDTTEMVHHRVGN